MNEPLFRQTRSAGLPDHDCAAFDCAEGDCADIDRARLQRARRERTAGWTRLQRAGLDDDDLAFETWEHYLDVRDAADRQEYLLAMAAERMSGESTTTQSAWYDTTTWIAPAIPGATPEQVRSALYDRWANGLTGSSVGGYITPAVRDLGDGTWAFDRVYHIGD